MDGAWWLCVALTVLLQTPAGGGGVVQGQVIRSDSRAAVAAARVVAAKVGGPVEDYRTVSADVAGRFLISGLPSGTYRIYAHRDGFRRTEYGQHPAGTSGRPVVVTAAQSVADILISVTPLGVVAGLVTEGGHPVPDVQILALRPVYVDGERQMRVVADAVSDDRGEYRLFDLAPGTYLVSAERPVSRLEGDYLLRPVPSTLPGGLAREARLVLTPETIDADVLESTTVLPVFYPGVPGAADAAPVAVAAGAVVSGINLDLPRVPVYGVRGRVQIDGIDPSTTITVSLTSADGARLPIRQVKAIDGRFDIDRVPPGTYEVRAGATFGPGASPAATVVVVAQDVEGLVLGVRPGVTIAGRVSMDGDTPPVGRTTVQLIGEALPRRPVEAAADGSFVFEDVAPGRYRFRVARDGRATWIRAARLGTDDVRFAPMRVEAAAAPRSLDIVLGEGTGAIDVRALDAAGRPAPGVLVVAVPDVQRRGRSELFAFGTTGGDGRVRLDEVAPGRYEVFASADLPSDAWPDPELLGRVAGRGTTVRVDERAATALDVGLLP
jgi:hypothetical protein